MCFSNEALHNTYHSIAYDKKSHLFPIYIGRCCIYPVHISQLFLIPIEGFIPLRNRLRLLSWLYPTFLFTMWLLLSTMVIVGILFALALSSLVGIPSILTELFDALVLLLLPAKLLLLLFYLFLFFLLFPLVLFFTLLLDRGTHIHILSILC